jgi:hypothetical protein
MMLTKSTAMRLRTKPSPIRSKSYTRYLLRLRINFYIFVSALITIVHLQGKYTPKIWTSLCTCFEYPHRDYFYVLENAIESNETTILPTFFDYFVHGCVCCLCLKCCQPTVARIFGSWYCSWIPPNKCCHSVDNVNKTYFDRGEFDRQSWVFNKCCGCDPIFQGSPTAFTVPRKSLEFSYVRFNNKCLKFILLIGKFVFCCFDCNDFGNEVMEGHFEFVCGEKVDIQPCQTACGYPVQANCCCNCCSLFGPKNGQPVCFCPIAGADCLAPHEGEKVAHAINTAYAEWVRTTFRSTLV